MGWEGKAIKLELQCGQKSLISLSELLKGSASNVLGLVYRNSIVQSFFPGFDINTYANFQKTLPRVVLASTYRN